MVAVVSIVSRHANIIETHQRNQLNKSKLGLHDLLFTLTIIENKYQDRVLQLYKGDYSVCVSKCLKKKS